MNRLISENRLNDFIYEILRVIFNHWLEILKQKSIHLLAVGLI